MLSEELEKAISLVAAFVDGLETAVLAGDEAASLTRGFTRLVRLGEAGTALCARRVAETRSYERLGHPNAEAWLSKLAGRPARSARSLLETAGSLSTLPGLESALRAGELSSEQAAEVARGGAVEPSSLNGLLETARQGSLSELRTAADRLEAAARSREEDEARHARVRASRHLRTWNDPDGSLKGRFSLPPEEGARLLSALGAEANRRFDKARRAGVFEQREAYLADALCELATGGRTPPGVRLEGSILFHVSLEALVRGHLESGEECGLASGAHVPLSVVERYLARSRLRLVVWRGEDVCSIVSLKRAIPASVKTALVARDRTCVVPGCSSTFMLEIDHLVPFAEGGPTRLSNLARLCRAHHAMKSEQGWRLEGRPGRWRWLPPLGQPPPAGRRRKGRRPSGVAGTLGTPGTPEVGRSPGRERPSGTPGTPEVGRSPGRKRPSAVGRASATERSAEEAHRPGVTRTFDVGRPPGRPEAPGSDGHVAPDPIGEQGRLLLE